MTFHLSGIIFFGTVALLTACGSGGSDSNEDTGAQSNSAGNNQPISSTPSADAATSLYDASRIRAPWQASANLIANGQFESVGDWQLCGAGLQSETAQGQYLRLDSAPDCPLRGDSFQLVNSAAYHPISLDTVPDILHISFLARSSQPIELFSSPVDVYLVAEETAQRVPVNFGAQFNNYAFPGIGSQWTPVKMSMTRAQMREWIGDAVPNWLMFRTAVTAGYQMDIDDVRLSFSETTLAEVRAMPDDLIGSASDRLLFSNFDEQFVGSVNPDGTGYAPYPAISTENLRMSPRWLDNHTITVGATRFYPSILGNDSSVVAAEGTDLLIYNLGNASASLIYQSIGSPGRFEFSGSFNNIAALDVTIRNGEWDSSRGRGAFAMCGQNRSWDFISDDICTVAIMDTSGNVLNSDTNGYHPAWSVDGQIAFVYGNNTFIGTVDGNGQLNARAVVSSGGTPRTVAWSPDGSRLAIMTDGVADVVVADTSYIAQSVSLLDVATGNLTHLALLDHGNASNDLTWIDGSDYLAYSILLDNPMSLEIWWLDTRTGLTGPIVNTINAGPIDSR